MTEDPADRLLEFLREATADELRAVVRYGRAEFDPVYARADVYDDVEEDAMGMFRHPFYQLHRAVRQLHRLHPGLDLPDVAVYAYGEIAIIQLPLAEDGGLLVTLDRRDGLPDDLAEACTSVVAGTG